MGVIRSPGKLAAFYWKQLFRHSCLIAINCNLSMILAHQSDNSRLLMRAYNNVRNNVKALYLFHVLIKRKGSKLLHQTTPFLIFEKCYFFSEFDKTVEKPCHQIAFWIRFSFCILYLANSTKMTTNTETEMLSMFDQHF